MEVDLRLSSSSSSSSSNDVALRLTSYALAKVAANGTDVHADATDGVQTTRWLPGGFCFCNGVYCFFAVVAVVLTGVLPALIMPGDEQLPAAGTRGQRSKLKGEVEVDQRKRKINRFLSFAVGSLLGDVFLHLLPELWQENRSGSASGQLLNGVAIIVGMLLCVLLEKCGQPDTQTRHRIAAVINLVANFFDNLTHGMTVAASFMVSNHFGAMTTFAILVHEIPHEIGDFAILMRADFNRWSAVKAQLFTALGAFVGACWAVAAAEVNVHVHTSVILPVAAGGFLNIALVQILPDLLKESETKESCQQLALILLGIATMATFSAF